MNYLLFCISVIVVSKATLGQTYYRDDRTREFRDSYGYYRYVRGERMYTECHDRRLEPRRTRCRGSYYDTSRNDNGISDTDYNEQFDGHGSYRIYGRVIDSGYSRYRYRRYRRRNSYNSDNYDTTSLRGEECPYSNFDTSSSSYNRYRRRRWSRTLRFDVNATDKILDSLYDKHNFAENEIDALAQYVKKRRKFRLKRSPKRRRNYYPNDRREFDSNGRRYHLKSGETDTKLKCPYSDPYDVACAWTAELSCDLEDEYVADAWDDNDDDSTILDRSYRNRRNSPSVRWTRINDSLYPRNKYKDVLEYLGSRGKTIKNGEILIIDKVYPEDKGTYVCEIEDVNNSRYNARYVRKKAIKFYPMYPCD